MSPPCRRHPALRPARRSSSGHRHPRTGRREGDTPCGSPASSGPACSRNDEWRRPAGSVIFTSSGSDSTTGISGPSNLAKHVRTDPRPQSRCGEVAWPGRQRTHSELRVFGACRTPRFEWAARRRETIPDRSDERMIPPAAAWLGVQEDRADAVAAGGGVVSRFLKSAPRSRRIRGTRRALWSYSSRNVDMWTAASRCPVLPVALPALSMVLLKHRIRALAILHAACLVQIEAA